MRPAPTTATLFQLICHPPAQTRSCPEPTVASAPATRNALNPYTGMPRSSAYRRNDKVTVSPMARSTASAGEPCTMSRAPSSRSMTTSGKGAWKGGGMVWFTTKVCTRPRRANATTVSSAPPHPMQVGWIDGGVEMVPHARSALRRGPASRGCPGRRPRPPAGAPSGSGPPWARAGPGPAAPRGSPPAVPHPAGRRSPRRARRASASTTTAVARPPPYPIAPSRPPGTPAARVWTRPSRAAAAPVSPSAPCTGADARGAPRRLATVAASLPSGSAMAHTPRGDAASSAAALPVSVSSGTKTSSRNSRAS